MKKLISMLAVVMMVATAQAGAVYWTCTNVSKGHDYVNGGLAFFVNAATLDQDSLLDLEGKGANEISSALASFYSYNGGDSGKYSVGKTSAVQNSALGLTDATDGNQAYLVIFDTETITDSSSFYLTSIQEFSTVAGANTKAVKWGDQEERSSASGAWHSVSGSSPIPEPTSALLLVGGLVALGLRRRRR